MPNDFWKPIEQSLIKKGEAYFVWAKGQRMPTIGVSWGDVPFRNFDYFAEIPALPKDETKL